MEILEIVIIPIVVAIINSIISVIPKVFDSDKQWKYIKEKSSRDWAFGHLMKLILSGMLFMGLYFALVISVCAAFTIEYNFNDIKIYYFAWIIICYGLIFILAPKDNLSIVFKYKIKNDRWIKKVIYKLPIVLSAVIWSCIVFDETIIVLRIAVILIIIFEIVIMFVLEREGKCLYNYVEFYFYKKGNIKNIEVNTVYQYGKWIVAKNKTENTEYRFRIKDIQRVVYKN